MRSLIPCDFPSLTFATYDTFPSIFLLLYYYYHLDDLLSPLKSDPPDILEEL